MAVSTNKFPRKINLEHNSGIRKKTNKFDIILDEWIQHALDNSWITTSSVNIIQSTYDELNILKTNQELVQGNLYLMTDYATIYDRPDYDNTGTLKVGLTTVTCDVEPLLLLAVSSSKFSSTVYSTLNPNDIIEYDFELNETFQSNSPTKGTITKRTDSNNNTTGYDHRAITFKRYDNGSGVFNQWKDNTNDFDFYPTFDSATDNVIENNRNGFVLGFLDSPYPNIVFQGIAFDNKIGVGNLHFTFIGDAMFNSFASGNSNFIFNDDCVNNIIQGANELFLINGAFSQNTIGYANTSLTTNGLVLSCEINNQNATITIGSATNCKIGNNNTNIVFGNPVASNEIGNDCGTINFGNSTYSNTIHRLGTNITIGEFCSGNDFHQGCSNITLGINSNDNQFYENCDNIVLGAGCLLNNFNGGLINLDWIGAATDLAGLKSNTFKLGVIDGSGWANKITIALHPNMYSANIVTEVLRASNGSVYEKYFDGTNDVFVIID